MNFECPNCYALFEVAILPKETTCPNCKNIFVPIDKNESKNTDRKTALNIAKSLIETAFNTDKLIKETLIDNDEFELLINKFPPDIHNEFGYKEYDYEVEKLTKNPIYRNPKISPLFLKLFSLAGDWYFVRLIFENGINNLSNDDIIFCFEIMKSRIYNGKESSYPYSGAHSGDYYKVIEFLLINWDNSKLYDFLLLIVDFEFKNKRYLNSSLLENILIILERNINKCNNSKNMLV